MEFTPMLPEEVVSVNDLRPEGWSDISMHFKMYVSQPECIAIRCAEDQKMLGVGGGISFGKSAWLAHIVVEKSHRRRGIGYGLVESLMDELWKEGVDTISLLATPDGAPVYRRAGFVQECQYLTYVNETGEFVESENEHLIPVSEEYLEQLFALDREVSGEDRSWFLSRCLENGVLFVRNGLVEGFFLPECGEGIIFALNEEAGIALLERKAASMTVFSVPEQSRKALAWLEQSGFSLREMIVVRMVHGPALLWKPECYYSRLGGNLG